MREKNLKCLKLGIKKGDTVSIMAANTPELFEAHYSVPMTGVDRLIL